jgi:hypothetical protein
VRKYWRRAHETEFRDRNYSQGQVDIGILAVPTQTFARYIGDNIAHYERVCRELPHARLSITLPIMVIGLEPPPEELPSSPPIGQIAEADEDAD